MTSPDEPRDSKTALLVQLLRDASDNCSGQYDDFYRSFVALDGKAQATTTASGVILAAVIAFVNAKTVSPLLKPGCVTGYVLVFGPAAGAVIAAILSVFAMRVVEVEIPFGAEDQIAEINDLRSVEEADFTGSHVLDFYQGRLEHWGVALEGIADRLNRKASFVLSGQIVMLVTLVSMLILFVYTVTSSSPS